MSDIVNIDNPPLRFTKESARELAKEHQPLYERHVAEVGYFKGDAPKMRWGEYFGIDDYGVLRTFCVRTAHDSLVGYALYFVRQNLHFSDKKIAQCDMIYIEPEHRGKTGERFIEWIDKSLKAEGVKAVSHHVKVYYDFGSMLKRLGYAHVENIYIRDLS